MKIPVRLKKIDKKPEVSPRRVYYKAEEIEKVLSYCDPMEWLLIKLPFDSGLRLKELTYLQLREINDRQLNYVGKGRKQRESYISPEARERLDDWIEKNNVENYLWARTFKGKVGPYDPKTIYRKIKKVFRRAGLKDGYPHALRHSFATDAEMNGATIPELREMLGHSNAMTTQVYMHALTGQKQKIFDQRKFGMLPEGDATSVVQNQNRQYTPDISDGAINFMHRLAKEFATFA
jgi:integrase